MNASWESREEWIARLETADRARRTSALTARGRSPRKRQHHVRSSFKGIVLLLAVLALLWPSPALAASVQARFDLSTPQAGPFPSDRFTVPDPTNNTGLRVNLPKPDC